MKTRMCAVSQVNKLQSTLAARAALLGIIAHPLTDDRGAVCMALSRGAWCEVLVLRQAEQLLTALEAATGRISTKACST